MLDVRNSLILYVSFSVALSLVYPINSLAAELSLSSDTRKELAQARRATARYHNIENAYIDGYIDADFYLPGVGCHLINESRLLDFEIRLDEPELLVYADCSGAESGRSELRSLEYAIPCESEVDCGPVPEGFSGDDDVWSIFGPNILWTLHAWVWRHNPDGIFVKINPRIDD